MLELLVFTKEVHLTEGEKMNRSGICQRLQDRWAFICREVRGTGIPGGRRGTCKGSRWERLKHVRLWALLLITLLFCKLRLPCGGAVNHTSTLLQWERVQWPRLTNQRTMPLAWQWLVRGYEQDCARSIIVLPGALAEAKRNAVLFFSLAPISVKMK